MKRSDKRLVGRCGCGHGKRRHYERDEELTDVVTGFGKGGETLVRRHRLVGQGPCKDCTCIAYGSTAPATLPIEPFYFYLRDSALEFVNGVRARKKPARVTVSEMLAVVASDEEWRQRLDETDETGGPNGPQERPGRPKAFQEGSLMYSVLQPMANLSPPARRIDPLSGQLTILQGKLKRVTDHPPTSEIRASVLEAYSVNGHLNARKVDLGLRIFNVALAQLRRSSGDYPVGPVDSAVVLGPNPPPEWEAFFDGPSRAEIEQIRALGAKGIRSRMA